MPVMSPSVPPKSSPPIDTAGHGSDAILDEDTKNFVRRALMANLVELPDIKKVVVSLIADDATFTPDRLAEGLVGADLLTPWQAKKLLAGKGKGFYLGNYRLLRPLGRGGMGVVFLAQHSVMNRLMALKILPREASKDARRIERFKEEARASAKLEHSNIVQAYDFSEVEGKLFIVMEYIEGIDLHRAIVRDGVMSPAASLGVMIQTADALAHAHQRGIVHRDIKPSNLMLRTDGVIKVSDMGLARIGYAAADGTESSSRLTGTADFISPEQAIDSHSADARADIYSLGCTWYFLLTGRPPFEGRDVAQRLAKHQTAPVPLVSELRADCPPAIEKLIQRMMSKRPEDRPASAAELLTQLKRIAGNNQAGMGSRSELANRPQSGRSTSISGDDSSSSLDEIGPLSDVSSSAAAEFGDIDFGSLPPIDMSNAVSNPGLSSSAPNPFAVPAPSQPQNGSPAKKAATSDLDRNQSMMLGIGLALAIMALLVVVGITFYTITKEDKPNRGLKTMESGKQVIVVND